jgi:hypothetical protein
MVANSSQISYHVAPIIRNSLFLYILVIKLCHSAWHACLVHGSMDQFYVVFSRKKQFPKYILKPFCNKNSKLFVNSK